MDRLDEAREVIIAATERFSLVLPVWLARFHVLAARGETEAARGALEEALRIRPGWGPAVRQLAACYSEEGRTEAHRALLESAVALDPLDEESHGGLADALWNAGEKEAAVERLQHALRIDPHYEWAWSALSEWSGELERPELPVETVRDLIARHPRNAELRVREARVRVDDLEGQLAALEEALRIDPYAVDAYDFRMELLARAERWDEAVATLDRFPARPEPVLLRGRAAWIEAQRGERERAIEAMRAVLADDPNYLWGWRNLAHWCDRAGDGAGYLQATEKLVQLSPREAVSHGLLGDARRDTGDLAGAEKSWWRALELAPDYRFAGVSLIDLQIKRQEYAEAARTLQYLEEHQPGEWVASRAVRLAARLGDRGGTLARLAALCRMPQEDEGPLAYADASVRDAGWSRQALPVYEAALEEPEAREELGGVWARARTAAGKWDCERRLPALLERGAIGNSALSGYLKALGEAHRRSQVRRVMRQFDAAIRADTAAWGMASHALVNNERPERVIDWIRDWKEREDVQPWMVLNMVLALRELGRDPEAAALGREALEIPEDGMSPCFRLWAAWDEALAGNPEVGALLADAVPPAGDAFYNFVRKLVEAIVEARGGSFPEARRRIHEARSVYACWPRDPLLRRCYRLALAQIRKDVPGPLPALWSAYWTLPAVLLLPGPKGLR
jgi:tetratricopeptide (TPR) repeat protein